MKKIKTENLILFAFGLLLCVYSFTIKGTNGWATSPGLFCLVCGIAVLSAAFFVKTEKVPFEKRELKGAAAAAVLTAYSLLLGKVHFMLITPVMLFIFGLISGRKNTSDNIISSLGISIAVYIVFSVIFGVQL